MSTTQHIPTAQEVDALYVAMLRSPRDRAAEHAYQQALYLHATDAQNREYRERAAARAQRQAEKDAREMTWNRYDEDVRICKGTHGRGCDCMNDVI